MKRTQGTVLCVETGLHRRLHSIQYYNLVNEMIEAAYLAGNTLEAQYANVVAALLALQNMLLAWSEAVPF